MELDAAYGRAVSGDGNVIRGLIIVVNVEIINGLGSNRSGSCSAGLGCTADDITDLIDADDADINRIDLADVMELDLICGCAVGIDDDIVRCRVVVINVMAVNGLRGDRGKRLT